MNLSQLAKEAKELAQVVNARLKDLYARLTSLQESVDDIEVGATSWDSIADKPSTFPPTLPIGIGDVDQLSQAIDQPVNDLATQNQTDAFLLALGNATGSLPQSQVTNLVADLADKATTTQVSNLDTRVSMIEIGYRAGSATNALTAFAVGSTDGGYIIQTTAATDVTITVNPLAIGEVVVVAQGGAGAITFVAGGGATLNPEFERTLVSPGQHSMVSVVGMPDGSILMMGGAAS